MRDRPSCAELVLLVAGGGRACCAIGPLPLSLCFLLQAVGALGARSAAGPDAFVAGLPAADPSRARALLFEAAYAQGIWSGGREGRWDIIGGGGSHMLVQPRASRGETPH